MKPPHVSPPSSTTENQHELVTGREISIVFVIFFFFIYFDRAIGDPLECMSARAVVACCRLARLHALHSIHCSSANRTGRSCSGPLSGSGLA